LIAIPKIRFFSSRRFNARNGISATAVATVPLSLAGALLSLHWMDQTLNVFSQIGIIMLIGIVTHNGILIVDFANQQRDAGLSKIDAVLEASISRIHQILMTNLSTILGILPIALS